jgi:hypothetical protein
MPANHPRPLRAPLLFTAAAFLFAAPARATETDALPTFESYLKVTGQAAAISGNGAAYQTRAHQAKDGGYGVEDLHYTKDVTKDTSVVLDGRALAGVEDYLARVSLTKFNVGSVEAGYKRFRTFYDGIGGFFPINNFWRPLANEDLHTDRGRFWFEAKLNLPEQPVLSLRYNNETRTGKKDSTTWGDSNLTGLPTVPANNATRKIIPAYLQLGERHEILEGRIEHTIGKTAVSLTVLGDWVHNDDKRTFIRYAGEVLPNPERINYQRDGIKTDEFAAIATTQTTLTDRVTLNTGLSFQHITTTISGERPNAIGVLPTFDFKDLAGGSKVDNFTANVSLGLRPTKDWLMQLTVRGEDSYTKSAGTYSRVTGTVAAPVTTFFKESSRVKDRVVTPDLSVRYTGFKNLVLYTSLSDRLDHGDRRQVNPFSTATPALSALGNENVRQDQAHYTAGANWNHSSAFTFRSEIFYKDHENKFIGYDNELGGRYVVGYKFTGLKFTAIVKPVPELSFTTRYVPQTGSMEVTTESTARFDSMKARSHLIGETVDWNPNPRVYVQANLNVAFNSISTAYPKAQTPLTIAPQRNSDNNYVVESLVSGFVVNKSTDVQILFTHQHAHNFQPEIATGTQPYGAGYSESTGTVGVKHKLSATWIASGKIGYIDSQNETTGGRTDFRGPLAYLAFERQL